MTATFIDLFSGAGLFSAGMIEAGLAPVLAVELSHDAVESYERNVAGCVVRADASEAFSDLRCDVLVAGPPCQGFSTLGRRDPLDERNELGLSVLPWVRKSSPRVVVIENVPPFVRSQQWHRLAEGLRGMGYGIDVWELDAKDFGTPQRRRRAFTVASKVGAIARPEPTGTPTTVAEAIMDPTRPVAADDPMNVWPTPRGVASERIARVPKGGDKRDIIKLAPELCPPSWLRMGCQATDAWGRMDADAPSNTLRCTFQNPSKGRYLHPVEDRVLSLREGARLQGVPDSWTFAGRPYPVARQIGNGVPIPLAAAVGKAVVAAL
ncbi:DNA cytosine methyltransferase [Aureimonas sp. AU22]|uniref:DNA cytosine methyltransferase n=1 Tax=Aureimonas sp. AU22 TaxID=1638162 RepID=UPI000785108F|nr:DNA cytosine methyltransferase [Aureimonas sp. AU22]